ncbi:disease resistance protein RUN1-like [Telopea speciosissima]|uniref:disease resistance protein RUN1-like n=1 Tax=Telopea speciosissima TaxID=54955 RepID=UPI001CC824D5|nr:disease resistance protein RUN1-like [Telopea speciosissima]
MAELNETSSSFSSASSSGSSNYDVFLNFRGEDTRKNFTGFLHYALKNKGINVFIDNEELWTGEAIGPTLLRAIQGSKISIPLFSKGYATSKWCLLELSKIIHCHQSQGQMVLPVFLDVEPSHVRNQTGSFEGPFQEHEKNFSSQPQIVEDWRKALRVVGELKGFVLKDDANGDQAKLVELIVKRALSDLVSNTYLAECKYSIGMDSRVNHLLDLLNVGSENIQLVGICGFGGIGKTTLAKAVYNHILPNFDKYSFLSDVREQATQCMGLVSLQKRLLKDIFKADIDIADYHSGKRIIHQRLCKEKVLVVLDDVDNREQVDALAGELNWFGQGSRLIITTRDEHILDVAKVDKDKIYKLQVLDRKQSLQLFSLHAFSTDQPLEDYIQLSHGLACYSGGVPLTLEVLGSSLSGIYCKEVWESTLQRLKEIPHGDVQRRLRISYDSLEDYCQKAIFLDAACFFIGWEKETVISFWEACGFYPKSAIDILIKRSLLKFKEYNNGEYYLKMHDQIRDMGRKIVLEESHMEPGKRSRLWSHDDVLKVLERHKVRPNYLTYFTGDFSRLPSAIRLLECNISNCLLINFYHKRLVILDLSYPNAIIEQAWNIEPQDENKFQNLKVLKLSGWRYLSRCPNFSWFPHLERLDLRDCNSLDKLDESIRQLSKLKTLILSNCSSLKKFPESIGDLKCLVKLDLCGTQIEELSISISRLSSLKELILKQCSSLKKLPESIGDLKYVVKLNLASTAIEELPNSISKLSSLKELILYECSSLKKLPESIGDLKCLVKLDLSETQIEKLPNSISKLSSLKELILYECSSLKKLPQSIGDMKCLVQLNLWRTEIEELPNSISNLSSLKELILCECSSLEKLPESIGDLKCLVKLDLSETQIEELPNNISKLSSLKELILSRCSPLKKLPESIGDMKCLVKLDLQSTVIEELPNSISKLSSLKELILCGCSSLEKLPESIGDLKCLVKLDLSETQIEELPNNISKLSSLKELILSRCSLLKKLPESIGDMKCLVKLELQSTVIEELPNSISKLSSLKELILSWCSSLKKLPKSIGDMKCLVELDLYKTKIRELPSSVSKLSSLKELILRRCSSLKKLPESIGDIKCLVKLDLYETKIEELPNSISKLSSLKELILCRCSSLEKLPESIGELKCLVKLDLYETKIEELPNSISKLSSLKELILYGCSSLEKLPESIGDLKCLVKLDLSETQIEELPNSISKLSSLKELILRCSSLKKLPESIGDLKCLVKLDLRETQIEELPHTIVELSSLEDLILIKCKSLKKLLPESIGDLKSLVKLQLSLSTKLEGLPKLPSSLVELHCQKCNSLVGLPDFSRLKNLSILNLAGCKKLEEIGGLERTESLRYLDVRGCYNMMTRMQGKKIHGQGTLLRNMSLQRHCSYSLTAGNDGNNKGLILCLVLEFISNLKLKHGGGHLVVSIDLDIYSQIYQRDKTTLSCCHTLGIEYNTTTTEGEGDIIYIHHFKGFDWFGIPLQGKDEIEINSIWQSTAFCGLDDGVVCRVKFWKLLFENKETYPQMVADFFKWSHFDDDGGVVVVPSLSSLGLTCWSRAEAEGSNSVPKEKEEEAEGSNSVVEGSNSVPKEEEEEAEGSEGSNSVVEGSNSVPKEEEKLKDLKDQILLLKDQILFPRKKKKKLKDILLAFLFFPNNNYEAAGSGLCNCFLAVKAVWIVPATVSVQDFL